MSEDAATRRSRRIFPGGTRSALESLSLGVGVVAFVTVAVVALPVFRFGSAPIAGEGSVGAYAAIASAVVAALAVVAGRYLVHARGAGGRIGVLDIVDVIALALAHAVIALLTWTLLAVVFAEGFIGAEVFALPVVILSGAAAAVTGYVAFVSASRMDLSLLATVLAVFLVEGVIAATLTANDPNWWEMNLSALGMTDDLSARTFNLTVVVGGVLVTTLARAATSGVHTDHPSGVARVRLCLVLIGVFLALIGIFHVDDFFAIHTGFASGMVVVYGVLVLALRRWMPGMPRAFYALGLVFIAVVLVVAVMFMRGTYTLTAVELIGGVLIFAWLILFIRNAAALDADARREAPAAVSARAI